MWQMYVVLLQKYILPHETGVSIIHSTEENQGIVVRIYHKWMARGNRLQNVSMQEQEQGFPSQWSNRASDGYQTFWRSSPQDAPPLKDHPGEEQHPPLHHLHP